MTFQQELTTLINKYNQEADSSTPDYILSEYLLNCLKAYNLVVQDRDKHLGVKVLGMKELVK